MPKLTQQEVKDLIIYKEEQKKKLWPLYKFNSPEELIEKIDNYFSTIKENQKTKKWITNLSVSGLAYHLWVRTGVLKDYSTYEEYTEIIDLAKQKIEMTIVDKAMTGELWEWFSKFYLKHCDWREDKKTIESTEKRT